MTRFLYIADTHVGANPMGYQQQQGVPEKLPELVAAIKNQIATDKCIAFVLHGGDMVEAATDRNLTAAVKAFDLPVPVYLCLGNHDLTAPDALERWLTLAPGFFRQGRPEYSIETAQCVLHVVPNHWEARPYYWETVQQPHFSAGQLERLDGALRLKPHLPHLLLTHSPVHGAPVEQTGFAEPFHPPGKAFTAAVTAMAARHGNLQCVLGAHNHLNLCVKNQGVHFVTVSALVETPFELKLFEVTADVITMSTLSLANRVGGAAAYDAGKAFVQGRPNDRAFIRHLRGE
jgi:hypothetical protein